MRDCVESKERAITIGQIAVTGLLAHRAAPADAPASASYEDARSEGIGLPQGPPGHERRWLLREVHAHVWLFGRATLCGCAATDLVVDGGSVSMSRPRLGPILEPQTPRSSSTERMRFGRGRPFEAILLTGRRRSTEHASLACRWVRWLAACLESGQTKAARRLACWSLWYRL